LPSILGNRNLSSSFEGLGFFQRLVKSKSNDTNVQTTAPSGTNSNESYIDEVCGKYIGPLKEHLAQRESQIVDATKSFLPHIMLQENTVSAGSATVMRRCLGCLVYANATGVTQLAETLAQRPGGAEVLSKCLNKFFTPLIDIIQAYRGDVIKFSGDALKIFFEATDDYQLHLCPCGSPGSLKKTPQQLACLRACACSLEIHKRLHEFDTGEGGVRLSLHCCIGAGDIALLQVGGEQRRFEYVIAGTPMEQIAIAEPLAGSGETVVSPQAWAEVDYTAVAGVPLTNCPPGFQRLVALDTRKHTYPTVKQAASDCIRLDEKRRQIQMQADLPHNVLLRMGERFIPRAVLKHLSSGNNSSINEMRSVTVIFAQIGGVDVSSDEGAEIAQKLMVSMQKACYAQEGNLNKFLVDHQGLLFLFVFGLPPVVHIDDPLRAITCCWDMVSVLRSMGLVGRLGVSTGRVFCGILGSVKRREYTVMGDTVNLAARLMSVANKNSVLIDEATFLRSEQDIVCKRLAPIKVKGKSQPIQVYAPNCPEVHGLEVGQLAGLLNQRSWNLEKTRIQVKLPEGISTTVDMPWRASSQLFGGTSPMLKLTRWRELGKVNKMLRKDEGLSKGLLEVGGSLMLLGLSGIGKQELAEYIVERSVDAEFIPLFGVMRSRGNTRWQAIAELIQNCLRTLYEIHQPTAKAKVAQCLEDEAEKLLQKYVTPDAKLRQVLAFLGFEGFEVPSERCSGETRLEDEELEMGAVEVAMTLVKAIAETHPVMVMLRIRRGTDIFDGLGTKASIFWRLSAELNQAGLKRRQDINAGALMKPILVVTISRKMPDVSNMKAGLPTDGFSQSLPKPTRILMSYLTEDAAVELMCHCLGLSASDGGLPIKRALRDFVASVTINVPTYIQECMHHLVSESWLKVSGGECIINSPDLNAVNVAGWVATNMVGSTISQLESLQPEMQNIMKLATVLEGAFSPLDLAAANRVLFGRLPGVLAFHDQAKLLKVCGELVKQGILRPVVMSQHTIPADKAPSRLPRWTIANSLVRKVAASMVLSSYRSLIKRAVLIERALNVELPQRIGLRRRNAAGTFRPGRNSNRLGKRVLRRTRGMAEVAVPLAASAPTPVASGMSLHGDSPFPEMQASTSPKATQEAMEMLFTAAVLGNLNVVLDVLSVNPDLDLDASTDIGGYTPVHFACSSGEVDVVHLLCEFAASVSVLSDKSETPLLVAAQRGHIEVVQYLCETQNALRISPESRSVEYWEKALPEIREDGEIPGSLSPAFGGPSLTQDALNEKRKSVAAFLFTALEIDGLFVRPSKPSLLLGETSQQVGEKAFSSAMSATESAAGSSIQSRSIDTSAYSSFQHNDEVAPETVALKEKRIKISGTSESCTNLRLRIRVILRGRLCLSLMLLALGLALYIPDVWVSIGAPSQTGADVILTTVMLMFLTELILLSLVDSTYPLSFFFFMDCIGTFSMIWDLSYLLGTSATEPQNNQSSKEDLTLFRATRTAKIGARAGRLSRLVKVMRFLPGMGMRGKGGNDAEQLHQISNQLTNVLSKRVACLTILLVIIMPLFTLGLYPEADFSMRVWLEALSRRVAAREAADTNTERMVRDAELTAAINEFTLFYQQKDYGPYHVCIRPSEFQSECYHLDSRFSQPDRINFQFDVSSDLVEASFDYSAPTQAEANMGITLISIVIVLMCGACLLLNYSASELAVRPLEKMLGSIKTSAQAIFSSTAAMKVKPKMESERPDDEDFDDQMDSEVALIERVVKKIATLVEVSRQEHPFAEASVTDMKGEELGVLAMTTGTTVRKVNSEGEEMVIGEEIIEIGRAEVTMTMQWQLEEIGVEYELFNSLQFNALEVDPVKQKQISAWLLINNPGSSAFTENNIDMKCMRRFIDLISQEYLQNPYHNFMHALDVTHTVFRYMTFMCAEQIFSMQEQFSLLVAALSHDVGHPGFNTMFLREVQHELTIRYNDHSPLENMHCCKFFEITAQSGVELFQSIPADQYREVRKLIIEVILHTDICQHPTMVKELELLYEMNSLVFEQTIGGILTEQEVEVLAAAQHKQLIAKVIVHSADISNPTKSWLVAKAWADAVLEEYFAQGDKEKKLGIPVQMLNDRDKVKQPMSQIGFIEFIVAPLVAFQVKIFPSFRESISQLDHNLKKWEVMWAEEAKPQRSESEKVFGRVQKVSDMLSNKVRKRGNQAEQPARTTMLVRRTSQS